MDSQEKLANDLRAWVQTYRENYPATARLDHYERTATERLKFETDDEAREHLSSMLRYLPGAREALEAGDIDRFTQSFERIARNSAMARIPDIERAYMQRKSQGNQSRKGKLGTLAKILTEIADYIQTWETKKVAAYWAVCSSANEADEGDELAFRHGLWAEQVSGSSALSRLTFHYLDGETAQTTRYETLAQTIRRHRPTTI